MKCGFINLCLACLDAAEAPVFPPFEMRFSENLGVRYVGLTFPDEAP